MRSARGGAHVASLGVRLVRATAACQGLRDAKDDNFLELALTADASTIVSSDDDLLVMHPWRGIRILALIDRVALPPLSLIVSLPMPHRQCAENSPCLFIQHSVSIYNYGS